MPSEGATNRTSHRKLLRFPQAFVFSRADLGGSHGQALPALSEPGWFRVPKSLSPNPPKLLAAPHTSAFARRAVCDLVLSWNCPPALSQPVEKTAFLKKCFVLVLLPVIFWGPASIFSKPPIAACVSMCIGAPPLAWRCRSLA